MFPLESEMTLLSWVLTIANVFRELRKIQSWHLGCIGREITNNCLFLLLESRNM
jgi:hypothetical protein